MLLLLFSPQPAPPSPEAINFALVMGDVYPQLNAVGPADLIYWTPNELYLWFDEAGQRLARMAGVFVIRDTSITAIASQGIYSLPGGHIATIQADLAGTVLRPRTIAELEALDADWVATVGPPSPSAYTQDTRGLSQIDLYPDPGLADNGATLGLVIHTTPATISQANIFLAAPIVIQDYFRFYALGEARAKESKGAMPEVAQWMNQLTGWMEQMIQGYWGPAE